MGRGRRDADGRKQGDGTRAASKEACRHNQPPHHRAQNCEARIDFTSCTATVDRSGTLRVNFRRSVAEKSLQLRGEGERSVLFNGLAPSRMRSDMLAFAYEPPVGDGGGG